MQRMKHRNPFLSAFIACMLFGLPAYAETTERPILETYPKQTTTSLSKHMKDMDVAVLRSIDKTYARTSTFEVPVGQTVKFGNSLFIRPQACRKTPPTKQPESAAFLQVWERIIPSSAELNKKKKKKEAEKKDTRWVFSGWMFASSPALSAMNHPIFDVWLIDCKKAKTSSSSDEEHLSDEAPPPSSE